MDSKAFNKIWVNPVTRPPFMTALHFKLHMRPYQHDLLELEIMGINDIDPVLWAVGTPIQAQYGRTPSGFDWFYGYVVETSRTWSQFPRTNASQRPMRVLALGTSWPMKDGLATVYPNTTAPAVARSLATSNHLDVDAPASSYVWNALASPGLSQWEFLCDVARKAGRTCHVHGTQLRFYDPLTVLERNNTAVPAFIEKDAAALGTVLNFTTNNTEMSSLNGQRRRNRVLAGTNALTGLGTSQLDSGLSLVSGLGEHRAPAVFTEYVTDVVTRNVGDSQAKLPAVTTANRFWYRAQASLTGDVRVTQETPVLLTGLGLRDSGLWQVLSVTHCIRPQQWYSIDVELGRDSDYDSGVRPGLAPGLVRAHLDGSEATVLSAPPTTLVAGRWRAAYTSVPLPGSA